MRYSRSFDTWGPPPAGCHHNSSTAVTHISLGLSIYLIIKFITLSSPAQLLVESTKRSFTLGLTNASLFSRRVMASTLFLVLDDLSTDFTYGGPQNWTVNTQPPWYGGTSTYPAFANAQTFGSFDVSFEGTSCSSMPFSHVRLDLQGYRSLSPATHPMPRFHNQSWSASMAAPHITHRTWTPHLNHTSNGISPQRCLRASIPSMWMV